MSPFRRRGGKRQPCRASTHHGQFFYLIGFCNHQLLLIAGPGINQTAGYFAGKDMIQTGLVTADTGIDLLGMICFRFIYKLGVSQEWPCH